MAKFGFLKNPELKRNLWLELTGLRLLILPLVLGIIVFLFYVSAWDQLHFYKDIFEASIWGMSLFTLYGIWRAASSVSEEVNQKTWEVQKMTPLSAWKMGFGKLFGSTAFAWYGVFLCLIPHIISMIFLSQTSLDHLYFIEEIYPFRSYIPFLESQEISLGLLALLANFIFALGLQALAIALSLLSLKNDPSVSKKGTFIFALGTILFYVFAGFTLEDFISYQTGRVIWYGYSLDSLEVYLLTSLFVGFWSLVALIRSMRAELKFKIYPWVWILFMLDLYGFLFGFFMGGNDYYTLPYGIWSAFVVTAVLFYGLLFMEKKPVVFFRGFLSALKTGSWKKVFQNMPLWMVSFGVTFLFTIFVIIFILIEGRGLSGFSNYLILPAIENWVAVILALIRDLGIVLFFTFTLSKRSEFAAFLTFFVTYVLFTAILTGGGLFKSVGLFYPFAPEYPVISIVSFAVQAGVVWLLVGRAYRKSLDRLERKS